MTCQYDGASLKIYNDGGFINKTDYAGVVDGGVGNLILGESYATGNPLCGTIDYLALCDQPLTDSEIKSLYINRYQMIKPPVLAWMAQSGATNIKSLIASNLVNNGILIDGSIIQ